MSRPQTCSYCHKKIVFARTAAGKLMPLNPDPDPAGNVACYRDGQGVMVAHVVTEAEPSLAFERIYMPHFATCDKRPEKSAPAKVPEGPGLAKVISMKQRKIRAERQMKLGE